MSDLEEEISQSVSQILLLMFVFCSVPLSVRVSG